MIRSLPFSMTKTRVLFSQYMAFQYVRGRNYRNFARASMADMFKLTYEDITDEAIRQELHERGLDLAMSTRSGPGVTG
jgi:hypothetical protein